MKNYILFLLALVSVSAFARQPLVNCEVITYLEDSTVQKASLESIDGLTLQGYFNDVDYRVLASTHSLDYLITGWRDFRTSGISPAPTKRTPFILKFSAEGNKHEFRCFAK